MQTTRYKQYLFEIDIEVDDFFTEKFRNYLHKKSSKIGVVQKSSIFEQQIFCLSKDVPDSFSPNFKFLKNNGKFRIKLLPKKATILFSTVAIMVLILDIVQFSDRNIMERPLLLFIILCVYISYGYLSGREEIKKIISSI